jgi:hypothetical protein
LRRRDAPEVNAATCSRSTPYLFSVEAPTNVTPVADLENIASAGGHPQPLTWTVIPWICQRVSAMDGAVIGRPVGATPKSRASQSTPSNT